MDDIIVVGCGGHAVSVIEVCRSSEWNVIGLVKRDNEANRVINGVETIGSDEDLGRIRTHVNFAAIGIGQIKSPEPRKQIFDKLISLQFSVPIIVARSSTVSPHAELAVGCVVHHNCFVNSNARIGDNTIINSGSIVEHDVQIGQHCHISTGVIINGSASIGQGSFVGSGSVVYQNAKIPEFAIIPAGTIVRS